MVGGNLLKGTGIGAGLSLAPVTGGVSVVAGSVAYAAGQALEAGGALTVAAGLAMLATGNSDGSQGNSGNMKRLSDSQIEKRTGTDVHNVKETIRDQFKQEMKFVSMQGLVKTLISTKTMVML